LPPPRRGREAIDKVMDATGGSTSGFSGILLKEGGTDSIIYLLKETNKGNCITVIHPVLGGDKKVYKVGVWESETRTGGGAAGRTGREMGPRF